LQRSLPRSSGSFWWNHIDPTKRCSFAEDFKSTLSGGIVRAFENDTGADDHAMLVTTSSFTQGVARERASLADLRLHLADGEEFKEWLGKYELNDDGFWLPDGWQMT
jgi:hypothetical protein